VHGKDPSWREDFQFGGDRLKLGFWCGKQVCAARSDESGSHTFMTVGLTLHPTGPCFRLHFCQSQRIAFKSGKMLPERADRLTSIGFQFAHWSARWEFMLAALQDYTASKVGKRPGFSSKLVHTYNGVEVKLGRWVDKQRLKYRKARLTEEEVARLASSGLTFGTKHGKRPTMDAPPALAAVAAAASAASLARRKRDPLKAELGHPNGVAPRTPKRSRVASWDWGGDENHHVPHIAM